MKLIQFLFVVAVPVVVVAGALVTLFAGGALLQLVEDPGNLRRSVEALFRRPLKPPREPRPGHYYRPHWQDVEPPR